jgi:hypothetical protein
LDALNNKSICSSDAKAGEQCSLLPRRCLRRAMMR